MPRSAAGRGQEAWSGPDVAPARPAGAWRLDASSASLTDVADATVRAYRTDVAAFADWVERGGVADPAQVDRLLLRRHLASLATRAQARATMARRAAGDPAARRRDDAVLELLNGSGLRVAELCRFDLGDVGPARQLVTVRGKGAKQRTIPARGPPAAAVAAWLERRRQLAGPTAGAALLCNRAGRPLGGRDVRRLRNRRATSPTSPHALRHTFATHVLDGGADLRAVRELLGQKSVSTTHVYTRVSKERLLHVHERTHPRG